MLVNVRPFGSIGSGTNAMLMALLEKGPLIPGPEIKNPNTSLNPVHVNSGYSSDANAYLNRSVSALGLNLIMYCDTSFTLPPLVSATRSGSGTLLPDVWPEVLVEVLAVAAEMALPEDITKPLSIWTSFNPFPKYPTASELPLYCTLVISTPSPRKTFLIKSTGGIPPLTTLICA